MLNFIAMDTVNFYDDPIEVITLDTGEAFVSIGQITGYLGLDIERILDMFKGDPRVDIRILEGSASISILTLNGFLMLLPYNEVPEELQKSLLLYQTECFEVLHNYWIHGIAINRRETPFNVTSRFRDERAVSRVALTKSVAAYTTNIEGARELGLDSDLFDKVLEVSYSIMGIKPKHEFEKLTGAQAKYISFIESAFAKAFDKFAKFGEVYDDPIAEALPHLKKHLEETGDNWLKIADAVPAGLYH